jgi:hypothetical protein
MWRLHFLFIKHKTTLLDRLKNILFIKNKAIAVLLLFFLALASCTEPYALQTNSYEEAIVIEATITNEFKNQEIKISRTFRFEENGPTFESGATVYLTDDLGMQYDFEEKEGKYISKIAFQPASDREYRLRIITKEGDSYTSRSEKLTTVSEITSLTTNVTTNENGKGVEIIANSFDPKGASKYYRYEYEETYKIIAPYWVNVEAIPRIFTNHPTDYGELSLQPRTTEARICFSSKKSNSIILTNTNNLSEDRVSFPVRFIKSSDYIIMHRYSILVKQYVQNLAAYTYYQTLKNLSGSESLLSQNQPGSFSGNIKSDDNPNKKVIGFFEISSFSEKRIFFNFTDLFPDEKLPAYPYDCPPFLTEQVLIDYALKYCFDDRVKECKGQTIINLIAAKQKVFYRGWPFFGIIPPSLISDLVIFNIQCGDCTSFSSNIKPLFWID